METDRTIQGEQDDTLFAGGSGSGGKRDKLRAATRSFFSAMDDRGDWAAFINRFVHLY